MISKYVCDFKIFSKAKFTINNKIAIQFCSLLAVKYKPGSKLKIGLDQIKKGMKLQRIKVIDRYVHMIGCEISSNDINTR